jgi:tetratricopeptide (TPR) repeat protein
MSARPSNPSIEAPLGECDGKYTTRIAELIVLVAILLLTSCSADPNQEANKLFVEAQKLIDNAKQQKVEDRLRTLIAANEKLATILSRYPSASLSVQLSSGQSIGTLSIQALAEQIADARWEHCSKHPKRACIASEAVRRARLVKNAEDRALALAAAARALGRKSETKSDATEQIRQALDISQSLQNQGSRSLTLAAIAGAQAQTEMTREAKETFEMAIKLLSSEARDIRRSTMELAIVEQLARVGLLARSLELAESVANYDPWNTCRSLVKVIEFQFAKKSKNELPGTIELLHKVSKHSDLSGNGFGATCLALIASVQANQGLMQEAATTLAGALKIARPTNNVWVYPEARSFFVKAMAEMGDYDGALQLARSIDGNEQGLAIDRTSWASIAVAYAKSGKFSEAIRVTNSFKRQPGHAYALAITEIAAAHAAVGNFVDALRLAPLVEDELMRVECLSIIAEMLTN